MGEPKREYNTKPKAESLPIANRLGVLTIARCVLPFVLSLGSSLNKFPSQTDYSVQHRREVQDLFYFVFELEVIQRLMNQQNMNLRFVLLQTVSNNETAILEKEQKMV